MSESSVSNWIYLMESGELKNKTVVVLRFIKNNPNTDIDDIRRRLAMPHQTITAIVSNLMDEGLVDFCGSVEKNGRTYSKLIYIEKIYLREQIKRERKNNKYRLWLKRGLEEHKQLMSSSFLMALSIEESIK